MSLEPLRERYVASLEHYEAAATHAELALKAIARRNSVECRISGRAKDVASLLRKSLKLDEESGSRKYVDPWNEIEDKVGVRAIVGRASDVDALVRAISEAPELPVIRVEDKRQPTRPSAFEYAGVHVQVDTGLLNAELQPIEAEVQLRTASQDVWSVVSHRVLYKGTVHLPAAEQRRIYRLVALVELFDEEVERSMDTLVNLPGYEASRLLATAEHEYWRLVGAEFDRSFSLQVLEAIKDTVDSDELAAYPQILEAFVRQNESRLQQLYSDYGPMSAFSDDWHYLLLSQPESLVLLERLEVKPNLLVARWGPSLPEDLLRSLAEVAAIGLP